MRAVWNGVVVAESNQTIVVEGNHYFPRESLNTQYFAPTETHTTCPWKGIASYFDIQVNGKLNPGAAWYYPEPKAAAHQIKDYVAFWRGVQIER